MVERPDAAPKRRGHGRAVEDVARHVARLIETGQLKPGDRLPSERELATQVGFSRPTLRAGLGKLAALGVIETRHGAGTFVTSGPPRLAAASSRVLSALHGFTGDEMYEARRVLEVGAAGLAARRASPEDMAGISEQVAEMFASVEAPKAFLVHDVRFHRAVAAASGNPVIAALVEMISSLVYEQRQGTAERATNLRESAEMHRRIYQAVRAHDEARARLEMEKHLDRARDAWAAEPENSPPVDKARYGVQ